MTSAPLLGEIPLERTPFPHLDTHLSPLLDPSFLSLPDRRRSDRVNRLLLDLLQKEKEPCFLLSPTLHFIKTIEQKGLLEHYTLTSFELWLNQSSGLSFEENRRIRGKIAGKWIERSDYEKIFPIGMGKVYEGTHFVTAHKSPDLDTTIASFWGWLDAFAARVGDGLHIWNLPGGPPPSQVEIEWIFRGVFGEAVFSHLAKTRSALTLTGNDLMTQQGFSPKSLTDSLSSAYHDGGQSAFVLTDEQGFFLGDWHAVDVEGVRQIILLLSSCLRWFENALHLHLITLFAQKELTLAELAKGLSPLFHLPLEECDPATEFLPKQKWLVSELLIKVLKVPRGLKATFEEVGAVLAPFASLSFHGLEQLLDALKTSGLFNSQGKLIEDRPRLFSFLEKVVTGLHQALLAIRLRLETLDIALKAKSEVFRQTPHYVTVRSEVEEIKSKLGSAPYLTVVYPDRRGGEQELFPVGIIPAATLRKPTLGTVSLRDFCNREEMGIPPWLEVISVIDHHKSSLQTSTAPFALVSDVQSSNTLVATQSIAINDLYSLRDQSPATLESEIARLSQDPSPTASRLLQRLAQKRLAAQRRGPHYIAPDREFLEYLHFLYGILDDTDLLSKVTPTDVECVATLLNRLKSLQLRQEVEIVSLDDLPRGPTFPKLAAQKILRSPEMYSLYQKVYAHREKEIEENLRLTSRGKPSNLFADTKEQNGCCRVGQTKLFAGNIPLYQKEALSIQKQWLEIAQKVRQQKNEVDLHLHMISTIVSAEEVYRGEPPAYTHRDEMWIWIPSEEVAIEHLKRFLNAFQRSPGLKNSPLEVEFLGDHPEELEAIFDESFLPVEKKTSRAPLPIAILRYKAGALNSRKAMVSPFLPKV